jgi:hypothetical protein
MEMSEAEVFKVTTTTRDGKLITAFVLPERRQTYVRMMREEYGRVAVEPMLKSDLPSDVQFS